MTAQNKISNLNSNLRKKNILFWDKGEMAYSAILRINTLKGKGFEDEADLMIKEWK